MKNLSIIDTVNPHGLSTVLLKKVAQTLNYQIVDMVDADIVVIIGDSSISASDQVKLVDKKIAQLSDKNLRENPTQALTTAIENSKKFDLSDFVVQDEVAVLGRKIVGITACPTGVAHTYMAQQALETYGNSNGYQVKIETRGQVGAGNELSAQEVADADVVIIAADIDVDLSKFVGKKLYRTSTQAALKKTEEVFAKALVEATLYQGNASSIKQVDGNNVDKKGIYAHLMSGVSHMLPMVVAGGLIIAISFIFGINAFKEEGSFASQLMEIGGNTAFKLIIPLLAGYIAFSIADRPGLAPGLVGGMLASTTGAGFIGGIIIGFIAGYLTKGLNTYIKLPQSMAALKPILILPFVATLIVGLLMLYVIGQPIALFMESLTTWLTSMQASSAIILGVLLGAMMCFDLGGPINKVAYTFGVGLIASEVYGPMAAVMAAGMVPPIAMGLATFIARKKFLAEEIEAGKAAFVLGLVFISEGAIPFAARDPLRVIPANVIGGAITGAISMSIGAQLLAPHGGIFVLLIPGAISPVLGYLIAIAIGSIITAIIYSIIKRKMN